MSKPRITLIARADNTGLGSQTWEFAKHMKPDHVFVIDLTEINAAHGKKTELHMERFPGAEVINGFPTSEDFQKMCRDTDMIFTVEIPYGYNLFDIARANGVKTVLQYNYEFLDYMQDPTLPQPDLFMAPSPWMMAEAQAAIPSSKTVYMPVPTNREVLPFRLRTEARKFLHIAGHPTHEDRNGTETVVAAMAFVETPIDLTIKCQNKDYAQQITEQLTYINNKKVNWRVRTHDELNYWDVYKNLNTPERDAWFKYDVLLLPRKYGGLSLQRNEAMSLGMPVIMTDIEPQGKELPVSCLVKSAYVKDIHTRTTIPIYEAVHTRLARKIEAFADKPKLVESISQSMDIIADASSWENMQPKYEELFTQLCQL